MVSEKVRKILLSKSDLTLEEIERLSEAEAWREVYARQPEPKPRERAICLTGFGILEKDRISSLIADAGYKIVGSVSSITLILCTGPNPGPAKVEKAKSLGIPIMSAKDVEKAISENKTLPAR